MKEIQSISSWDAKYSMTGPFTTCTMLSYYTSQHNYKMLESEIPFYLQQVAIEGSGQMTSGVSQGSILFLLAFNEIFHLSPAFSMAIS